MAKKPKDPDLISGDVSDIMGKAKKPDFRIPSKVFLRGEAPDWVGYNELIIPSVGDIPPLDDDRAFRLGYLGVTRKWVAVMYDMTVPMFDHSRFSNFWKKGQAIRNEAIAAAQLSSAIVSRNVTMQIFLGKNGLDQADNPDGMLEAADSYEGHVYEPVKIVSDK